MLAHGVGDVHLGLVVLRGVVPRSRARILLNAAVDAVPLHAGSGLRPVVEELIDLRSRKARLPSWAVDDVDDVAVVVHAGFDQQVGLMVAVSLIAALVGRVVERAGDGWQLPPDQPTIGEVYAWETVSCM